jgi:glycine betaine/proline transport system substrate-binding protein
MKKKGIGKFLLTILTVLIIASISFGVYGCNGTDDNGGNGDNGNGGDEPKPTINIVGFSVKYGAIQAQVLISSLEEHDYPYTYVETNNMGPLYLGIAQGDYDIYPDSWMPEFHKIYYDTHGDAIELVGNLYGEDCPTGLVVPQYVVDQYGITSIADLKDNAEVFDGKIYGYEAGTGGMMKTEQSVDDYGLEGYEIVYGSVPTLYAEVYAKYNLGEPIVYCGWRPYPAMADLDLVFLEDPELTFGTNYVGTCVNSNLKTKAPDVYEYISNQVVPLAEVEAMMAQAETVEEAMALAEQWWSDNKALVESWWP